MDSNHGHGATLSLNETSCLDMSGIDFMDWSSNTDDTDSHEFIQVVLHRNRVLAKIHA